MEADKMFILPRRMQWSHVCSGMWWLVCLCLIATGTAFAQVDQGTITGTVTDNSGAVVPGAQVTLTVTGLTLQAKSNGSGNYTFSQIKIGNYSVSASAPASRPQRRAICTSMRRRDLRPTSNWFEDLSREPLAAPHATIAAPIPGLLAGMEEELRKAWSN